MKAIVLQLLLLLCNVGFCADDSGKKFSVTISSIARNGGEYTFVVHVKCVADDFDSYYVHRPDRWGKAKFETELDNKITKSSNSATVSPLLFEGVIFRRGDEFKFEYHAKAEKNGTLKFEGLDEILPIYKPKSQIRILLNLFVSDFNSGKCHIEWAQSPWADIEFPFEIAPPPKEETKEGAKEGTPLIPKPE